MASRIEQAAVALVALLVTGVPDATVQRNRDIPVDFVSTDDAYLIVRDGTIHSQFMDAVRVEHAAELIIEGYVTADDYDELGPALDALLVPTWAVITGNPRLGSSEPLLSWDVRIAEPGIEREAHTEDGRPTQSFRMLVELRVNTNHSDLTASA
jgi:hypothetical protein